MKHIIKEIAPENCEFSTYFDNDGLTEKGGDYCYNLFIVCNEGYNRIYGFNVDEYKRACSQAESIIDGFGEIEEGMTDYNGRTYTYKDIMTEEGIEYNPKTCHSLKEWAKNADSTKTEDIARYLTITTGKEWNVTSVRGYSQGDYCEIVYCEEHYDKPHIYGEIWLGCAKEFCVIDLDDAGNEIDSCYGFIVADSEARTDEDYKRIVCEQADIDETETRLEMIENSYTTTHYNYRTI